MDYATAYCNAIVAHWPVWIVTVTLVVAAVIDGFELKVPNLITFPMIVGGWVYSALAAASMNMHWWEGITWSLIGTAVGLGLLLPAYAIGGMGAGDVKLLGGIGAWMHVTHTIYAFAISSFVGAVLAVLMVFSQRAWRKHASQFWMILSEVLTIRDIDKLSTIAAERKSSMLLLPYGIPIAMGTIAYFAWNHMLL